MPPAQPELSKSCRPNRSLSNSGSKEDCDAPSVQIYVIQQDQGSIDSSGAHNSCKSLSLRRLLTIPLNTFEATAMSGPQRGPQLRHRVLPHQPLHWILPQDPRSGDTGQMLQILAPSGVLDILHISSIFPQLG
jgi:hypothetical protein